MKIEKPFLARRVSSRDAILARDRVRVRVLVQSTDPENYEIIFTVHCNNRSRGYKNVSLQNPLNSHTIELLILPTDVQRLIIEYCCAILKEELLIVFIKKWMYFSKKHTL